MIRNKGKLIGWIKETDSFPTFIQDTRYTTEELVKVYELENYMTDRDLDIGRYLYEYKRDFFNVIPDFAFRGLDYVATEKEQALKIFHLDEKKWDIITKEEYENIVKEVIE